MKNKTIQRILSFTLALILCFSIAVKPIEAKALAVESWLIYAIITYMAAVGFTFTAAGGANALMSAVEDRWGEFQEYKKGEGIIIDITPYIQYKPPTPSPGGNGFDIGPKFWYGVVAVAAIKDFIEWLKSDALWNNDVVNYSTVAYEFPIYKYDTNTGETFTTSEIVVNSDGSIYSLKVNDYFENLTSSYIDSYYLYFFYDYYGVRYSNGVYSLSVGSKGWSNLKNYNTIQPNLRWTLAIPHDDPSVQKYRNVYYILLDSNNNIVEYITDKRVISGSENYKENIFYADVPETIPEFDINENQVVEISFDAFTDNVTYETPEEFAEAIEQKIADTGTFPSIESDVILDPDSVPDVEPSAPPSGEVTPNPETPENPDLSDYPNIEELGLPALGDALFKKFPFCIPNDLKTFFGVLTAEPETPYWEVDLTGDALGIESKFVIDLTEYEAVGRMSRWGSVITFCLFLIMNTKRFIGW